MTDLLSHKVWPSPRSYSAKPLTAAEIDAHPDADRIWATIMEMRRAFMGRDPHSHSAVGR